MVDYFDTSAFTGLLFNWLRSWLFWVIVVLVFMVLTVVVLKFRKKRKLIFPTLEMTDLGDGKMGIKNTRAGWFKNKTMFFGLWDYGNEDMLKLKDGRKVQQASSVDFHDINGKRGLVIKRKDDDPKILVPLKRLEVRNIELLADIAPSDYRDASVSIIKTSERETMDKLDKYMPYIMIGFLLIFSFISIVLIVQMVKNGQKEASELILQAGKIVQQARVSTAP